MKHTPKATRSAGLCALGAYVVLCGCYFLLRDPLFSLHGMIELPRLLLQLGWIVLLIGTLLHSKFIPLLTALGYPLGFLAGYLFQRNGVDSGGGSTSNLWILWCCCYLTFIAAGVLLHFFARKKAKNSQ